MRFVVNDHSGHPFQAHLSRHLARRGHDVSHLYFADLDGPKGSFEYHPSDPPSLRFIGITLGGSTHHPAGTGKLGVKRIYHDLAYGRKAAKIIRDIKPDVVLCGNTPPDAQRAIIKFCKKAEIRFVYWVQDLYGLAVSKLLTKEFGVIGKAVGWYFQWLDHRQFRSSDAIVSISDDFIPLIPSRRDTKVAVIENWGAIEDVPVGRKDNIWSREHNLHNGFAFVYSGTLGRKHNPRLLLQLAQQCGGGESVIVVGQGFGVPFLQTAKGTQRLDALKILPIQPQSQLANVLATADVLLATIEADAGIFAVPSKVLSYLCAGRPILLAAPKSNLAARVVERACAGIVVDPGNEADFISAANHLRAEPSLRAELGANGRAYAERTFDMTMISDKFEKVLMNAYTGEKK